MIPNETKPPFTLTVLYTTDVHGNALPHHYADNSPSPTGFARLAPLIRAERRRHDHTLLLDNGDLIQGTPFTYYYSRFASDGPHPMISVLNELGYDAAVIGNHEFNYGMDLLNKAVRESRFPWMAANIVDAATGEPYFGKPYLLKEYPEGVRVAVLGLTTHYTPNWEHPRNLIGLVFKDACETAKIWVKRLKEEERADLVIVSYHGGFERNLDTGELTENETGENQGYRMCMEVPGIDILLTGHQHREIDGACINGVRIIQAGGMGMHLGMAEATLQWENRAWRVTGTESKLLHQGEFVPDPAVVELVSGVEEGTQRWLDQPIGFVEGDMTIADPMKARLAEHPYIEFLNRVQMEAAEADISCTSLFDNWSPGFGSRITMREIVANYIYPNTLKVLRVSGQDIKDALERAAAYFEWTGSEARVSAGFSDPKPQHYNYDMWEGIEYELDIARPLGDRVVKLEQDGKPLDPAGEYDVAMNNYRAVGGGEYPMFKDKPVVRDITVDVSELLAGYILEKGTIKASVNRNWKVTANGVEVVKGEEAER
ncbi:bifunctional metallophosphatase/5'-nucleotidase [Cohnella fermenti]|uniref:Bifunctional metallophosphatase/5'-nucleotidase n=1 Tax=Cohnella fermenti TaxID=2565925 RepID=A0A4S4C6J2_9BACL|nr:bifunctional UDP-sugar hydrolase/5'-nucleotidase [Cohnella fermenti]THF83521.1 bifunctional metallophosphatase/5'-nucleotidase [Cohnella fermenti]